MTDITTKLLQQIRDEMRSTRVDLTARLDATNARLDATNGRLETTNEGLAGVSQRLDRLERRQTETEVRLATEIIAVAAAITDLKNVIVEDRKLRTQVSNHENRIKALERKRAS
jgi:chromosome segregation ATPase